MFHFDRLIIRRTIPAIAISDIAGGGVKGWLRSGAYTATCRSDGAIVLENVAAADLLPFLSYDYTRFALSCAESFSAIGINKFRDEYLAWSQIASYYAAFFGGHAIMRAAGRSVTYFNSGDFVLVDLMLGSVTSNHARFSNGCRVEMTEVRPGMLEVTLIPVLRANGVHAIFWKEFEHFLVDVGSQAAISGDPDANAYNADLALIAPMLRGFLSATRNSINYDHLFDLWFPAKNAKKIRDRTARFRAHGSSSIPFSVRSRDELERFEGLCVYFSKLSIELSEYIALRASGRNNFGVRWRRFKSQYSV